MSALTTSAFATLLATCAPNAPIDYMQRIAHIESGRHPYAMHDNTDGTSAFPETLEAAVSLARTKLAARHSIDVGLMGINVGNWGWLGLSVETALDPCKNVQAGARVFENLSRYNTGDPRKGFANGYVLKVLANIPQGGQPTQVEAEAKKPPEDTEGDDQSLTTTYEDKN